MKKLFELRILERPLHNNAFNKVLQVKYLYESAPALDRGDLRLHYLKEIDDPVWEDFDKENNYE